MTPDTNAYVRCLSVTFSPSIFNYFAEWKTCHVEFQALYTLVQTDSGIASDFLLGSCKLLHDCVVCILTTSLIILISQFTSVNSNNFFNDVLFFFLVARRRTVLYFAYSYFSPDSGIALHLTSLKKYCSPDPLKTSNL